MKLFTFLRQIKEIAPVVVTDRDEYNLKVGEILSSNTYTKLNRDPTATI